mmetsp:Transcript_14921/g.42880  ORF Transcript_14921/g.42880 Transcript_14921/m.42880 type:complete len:580 (+) Transcript_14921:66-1805(+)
MWARALQFSVLCLPWDAAAAGPQVQTSSGTVEGNELPGANEFLGIPFAEPTRRFEPPEDLHRPYSSNLLQATDFGFACLQVGDTTDMVYGSEDCLYANVWQPAGTKPGANLPVLVFIYGGSNQFGEPEPYNGSAMAVRQGVVYVSIAYRTGPIGWMAFEEDRAAGRSTGNFGLLDTQSGLRWVQREIRSFGGDPSKVAIHGQSSGAMLVELHLVMPGSRGLLSGLVSESGGLGASALQVGIQAGKAIGKQLNCGDGALKACLQAAPALALTNQTYSFPWGPHVDGVTVPADPLQMLRQGRINPVSVIMGAQTNDTFRELSKQFVGPDGHLRPLAEADYFKMVFAQVGPQHIKEALALYPADSADLVRNVQRLGSIGSDRMLCGIRQRLSLVNKVHPGHAYMYRFNWWYKSNSECSAEPNYHSPEIGAVHEDEVTFVMGQPIFMQQGSCCGKWGPKLAREPCAQAPECVACWRPDFGEGYRAYFNEQEWNFSAIVSGFWAAFAATGTPNGRWRDAAGTQTAKWPEFPQGGAVTHNIVLDADLPGMSAIEQTLYDDPSICSFWDRVGAAPALTSPELVLAV